MGASSPAQSYTVTINPAVTITKTALVDWTVNLAGYSQTVTATGGTGARTFSVSAGALPGGLTLNSSTGVLSGTPTAAATYSFTLKATDTVGASGTQSYTVTINPAVSISTTSLPSWTQSFAGYSQMIVASGGTGTLTFTGTAPAGLTLNADGTVTGTPGSPGRSPSWLRRRIRSAPTPRRMSS